MECQKVCPISPSICELLILTEELKTTAQSKNKQEILNNLHYQLLVSQFDCSSGKNPWQLTKTRQALQETVSRYFFKPDHPYIIALKNIGLTGSPVRVNRRFSHATSGIDPDVDLIVY
ncbi:MAG: hypothetical protein Q7R97_04170 [Candidatus Daviesbacteria bacterium]|nr:hypothetical protein [Candidatus Daviesbacteria bacterium]